jgi:GNAT superfamily N-acetyltransferase
VLPPYAACLSSLSQTDAQRLGYLWGVYVLPDLRGRGVGGTLVSACMAHLKSIGCGRVLLHAGERSAPLYERMGFKPTVELSAAL